MFSVRLYLLILKCSPGNGGTFIMIYFMFLQAILTFLSCELRRQSRRESREEGRGM